LQWVVEGGDYKASYLLPDDDEEEGESSGLLITETVVPGFELADHDFLTPKDMEKLSLRIRVGSWTGCLEITSHEAFYTCRGSWSMHVALCCKGPARVDKRFSQLI
jgi:hypothetical protein